MAPRRLLEFTAGRSCAHDALVLLGAPSNGIPVGPGREPLWPAGIVGSISHSGDLAVATVAPMALLRSIGVDIEPATPLEPDLQERICTPAELARLRSGPDAALGAKIVFSAKESVYKCLWPLDRQFLEFSDVEVLLGDAGNEFAVIVQNNLQEAACNRLAGRIAIVAGHIITVAYLAA